MFEVIKPGLQTSIQDIGRRGFISRGIPPAGAFDSYSFRIGNLIVGNGVGGPFLISSENCEAGLELTFQGPGLRVLDDVVAALTGADMSATVDGKPFPMWEAFRLRRGETITFGTAKRGARGYLCVAGGFDVPLYLGSRSTQIRGNLGGMQGRCLKPGDQLPVGNPRRPMPSLEGRVFRQDLIPQFRNPLVIRVIMGPQNDLYQEESLRLFLATEWKASSMMDRMGIRLIGPKLSFKPKPEHLKQFSGADPSNIVSDTIPIGGIQVPSGIEPIIMGVEGPGIGGYAKIATVISADLSSLGQIRPGDQLVFREVNSREAVDALREREALLQETNIEVGGREHV